MSTEPDDFSDKVVFVWKVADKLRGHFKPHEYGSVILPLLVLRRLDAVLESTKAKVLAKAAELESSGLATAEPVLKRVARQQFYNVSPLTFKTVLSDDKNVAASLRAYVNAFSPGAVEVLEEYRFDDKINRLDKAGILYSVLGDFADLDLHPKTVSNETMGRFFEELLRKFSEMSNETAGEHYTPREVIKLMVNLLFAEDNEALTGPAPVRTVYDPAAGTGGMLTVAEAYLTKLNPEARVEVYGQELNPETWAIARSDLMIKGADPERMVLGNSLTNDGWAGKHFDYVLANPPYGVDWKAYSDPIKEESEKDGFQGRFGAGLPRISDGSFLFLQHMISKMKPVVDDPKTPWIDGGSRIGIVLSGSPMFSGGAGSGESEIRRWIIENDWLEGVIALPDQMFYNTGIFTYVWILTNRKPGERRGKVILIDSREMGTKIRRSLGDKRKEITDVAISEITKLFADALEIVRQTKPDKRVKVMRNEEFGYARLTVERPLRRAWSIEGSVYRSEADARAACAEIHPKADAKIVTSMLKSALITEPNADPLPAKKGSGFEADPDLREQENIPLPIGYFELPIESRDEALRVAAESHLDEEIRPFVPDAWIDHDKTRIGYEIPFTRQFYEYTPPRAVSEIRVEIDILEDQIQEWLKGFAL